jgi:hypothetical protein
MFGVMGREKGGVIDQWVHFQFCKMKSSGEDYVEGSTLRMCPMRSTVHFKILLVLKVLSILP